MTRFVNFKSLTAFLEPSSLGIQGLQFQDGEMALLMILKVCFMSFGRSSGGQTQSKRLLKTKTKFTATKCRITPQGQGPALR